MIACPLLIVVVLSVFYQLGLEETEDLPSLLQKPFHGGFCA
jgi:hypothetical protein